MRAAWCLLALLFLVPCIHGNGDTVELAEELSDDDSIESHLKTDDTGADDDSSDDDDADEGEVDDVADDDEAQEEEKSASVDNNFIPKTKSIADIPGLSKEMLDDAYEQAEREQKQEDRLSSSDETPQAPQTFQDAHYKRFVPALEPERKQVLITERMIRIMAEKLSLSVREAAKELDGLKYDRPGISKRYFKNPFKCNRKFRYRAIDGTCNNLKHPYYGASMTAFTRITRADYADGVSAPRKAKSGNPLPNARKVSFTVFRDEDRPSKKVSHMNMVWGQFIDHDIDHGAQPAVDCSGTCGFVGECAGIPIPANDPPFNNKNVKCIQMKRDVPLFAKTPKIVTVRQQVNIKTSFIDGSQIYGDTKKRFKELVDPNYPWLLLERNNPQGGKKLLPKQGGFCVTPNVNTMPCFKSGDFRTNENPGLSSLHTIFSREHNRIATELRKMNRHWPSDKIYLETRKIVAAQIQHITYKEFLPLILDRKTLRKFGLRLKRGYYRSYNKYVNPSIFNAFAGAAYRFGHSQITNIAHRFGRGYVPEADWHMNETFNPTALYKKEGVDSLLRGFAMDASQKTDAFFSKSVHEQLRRDKGDTSDLAAINTQRGREHGLPGYNVYRQICGLTRPKTFRGFGARKGRISKANIKKLKNVYAHPDDVDLFVGGLMEKPVRGGIMGPTFSCLLAKQFSWLRRGDRFWYERRDCYTGFTCRQLKEIRRVSLARLLCDNGDHIRKIQRRVLAVVGRRNRMVLCRKIRRMSLKAWKDFPGYKHRCNGGRYYYRC